MTTVCPLYEPAFAETKPDEQPKDQEQYDYGYSNSHGERGRRYAAAATTRGFCSVRVGGVFNSGTGNLGSLFSTFNWTYRAVRELAVVRVDDGEVLAIRHEIINSQAYSIVASCARQPRISAGS